MTQIHSSIRSSRFINMCVANWFLHIFLFGQTAIVGNMVFSSDAPNIWLGVWMLTFAVGMIVAGPFGACIMERHKRKRVYLKSVIVQCFVSTLGLILFSDLWALAVVFALQGACYGISQIAMGTTLVNDMLVSEDRTRGDNIYAWSGRMGVPCGLLAGCVMSFALPFHAALWWLTLACLAAYVLVAQTPIPVKAPVKMPRFTLDRFFLPAAWRTILTFAPAPLALGWILAGNLQFAELCVVLLGYLSAFVLRKPLSRLAGSLLLPNIGYAIVAILLVCEKNLSVPENVSTAFLLPEILSLSLISAAYLLRFLKEAEHCERGTAQNTHLLIWRLGLSLGFLVALC